MKAFLFGVMDGLKIINLFQMIILLLLLFVSVSIQKYVISTYIDIIVCAMFYFHSKWADAWWDTANLLSGTAIKGN